MVVFLSVLLHPQEDSLPPLLPRVRYLVPKGSNRYTVPRGNFCHLVALDRIVSAPHAFRCVGFLSVNLEDSASKLAKNYREGITEISIGVRSGRILTFLRFIAIDLYCIHFSARDHLSAELKDRTFKKALRINRNQRVSRSLVSGVILCDSGPPIRWLYFVRKV